MKYKYLKPFFWVIFCVGSVLIGLKLNKEALIVAFLAHKFKPLHTYEEYKIPDSPNYSNADFWLALPGKSDSADISPVDTGLSDNQENAKVDVFYVHPTTYLNKEGWSADAKIDIEIGKFDPLHTQASVFNGSARIYAPRYRQATVFSFFDESSDAHKALSTAHLDVINAFIFYLAHYNQGRPFFIAGHSQGSKMLIPVLQFLDKYPNDKFIAAYVPGWSIKSSDFAHLGPCQSGSDIACYNVWNSKEWGAQLDEFVAPSRYLDSDCVNPLSWKNDEVPVSEGAHFGAIDMIGEGLDTHYVKAKCEGEMLWVTLPDNPRYQSALNKKNYHVVDYGLFYMNIRQNIGQRIEAYKQKYDLTD